LRAQYEKEGDYVGVQTKFNYAWVCQTDRGVLAHDLTTIGSNQVEHAE
jgi:hypothetical protein